MKKVILIMLFILLVVLIKWFDLEELFTFENLKLQQERLTLFVQENFVLMVVAYIGLYIASVAFLIPIATIMTLAGGFLFGAVVGTLFVNIGATLGAILAFIFARYIIGEKIQEKYAHKLERFNQELEESKYQYLFSLRLLPIFPFFLVNFFCGVTRVDLKAFIITTSIGIIPGSFVYTYAGSQLAQISAIEDIFTKEIMMALVLLALLVLMPTIIKKIKARKKAVKNGI